MRLGSVPYLNAKPLNWGLDREPDVEMTYVVPSQLAVKLKKGEIAAGLVSVVACFLNPDLQIAPGISISSIGPADSVRLFHKGSLDSVQKVALDTSSLTSVTLARVILAERYGIEPEFIHMPPSISEMFGESDAAVIIGDPAMKAYAESEWPSLDLGDEWHALTGLPFVFAVWAVNPKLAEPSLTDILMRAKSVGMESLEEISESEAERLGFTKETCLRYLTEVLNYDMAEAHIEGLTLFREKARKLKLVPQGELKLFGV